MLFHCSLLTFITFISLYYSNLLLLTCGVRIIRKDFLFLYFQPSKASWMCMRNKCDSWSLLSISVICFTSYFCSHAIHDIYVIKDARIKKCQDVRVLIFLGKLKCFDLLYTVIRSELEASHLLNGSLHQECEFICDSFQNNEQRPVGFLLYTLCLTSVHMLFMIYFWFKIQE